MANIPLSQVPNAPQPVAPVLTDYPGKKIDLSGAASQMMTPGIAQGAFDAPAKGQQAIAEGIAQSGGVFRELAGRLQDSKNYADIARASATMQQAHEKFYEEAQSLPPEQREPLWQSKYRPDVEKQFDQLGMSQFTKDRVLPQWIHFDATTRTNIAHDNFVEKISDDNQSIENLYNQGMSSGDYGLSYRAIEMQEKAGHLSAAQARAKRDKTDDVIRGQQMEGSILNDPRGTFEQLNDAAAGKKTNIDPYIAGNPQKLAFYLNKAKSNLRVAASDTLFDLSQGVDTGEIKTKEDMASAIGKTRNVLNHWQEKTAYGFLPKANAVYDPAKISEIQSMIAGYHSDSDPGLQRLYQIGEMISSSAPYGSPVRRKLMEDLADANKGESWAANPQATMIKNAMLQEIQDYGKSGLIVPTGMEGKVVTDKSAYSAYGEKMIALNVGVMDFIKQNPNARPEDATKWIQENIGKPAADQAAKYFTAPDVPAKPAIPMKEKLGLSVFGGSVPESAVGFIKNTEGWDNGTWDAKQYSTGYGSKARFPGEKLTKQEADARLREELAPVSMAIDKTAYETGLNLTDKQKSALLSFGYNAGEGAVTKVLRAAKGDRKQLTDLMGLYIHSEGKVNSALVKRRADEIALFNGNS